MDNQAQTTAERPVAKAKVEIIKEATRIEEGLLYTSKGHFAAARFWSNFHLWVGIPMVILSAIIGATAFAKFDTAGVIAGFCSIIIVALSSVITFLNPNQKSSAHLNAGNNFDSLMNKARIFRTIDCWQYESDEVLTEKLKHLSEQKDKLNQSSLQVPRWAYMTAKKGIEDGEGSYVVDKI